MNRTQHRRKSMRRRPNDEGRHRTLSSGMVGLFSVKQKCRSRSREPDPRSSAGAPGSASDGGTNEAREGRMTAEALDVEVETPRSEGLRAGPGKFLG